MWKYLFVFLMMQPAFALSIAKIDPDLLRLLYNGQKVNILVSFSTKACTVLHQVTEQSFGDRGQRNNAFYKALSQQATTDQSEVIRLLSARSSFKNSLSFETFWIGNEMTVRDADLATVQTIARCSKVTKIVQEPELCEEDGDDYEEHKILDVDISEPAKNWSQIAIQLEEVREISMQSAKFWRPVVAIIDKGVQRSHETLNRHFRRSYGWYDPHNYTDLPVDYHGRGTSSLSLAVGTNGMGVAPHAIWMACRSISDRNGRTAISFLKKCHQFIACPHFPNGTNQNCSKTPQVLLYSRGWKWPNSNSYLNDDFEAFEKFGITVVAPAGNTKSGNACGSVRYPAILPTVIAVGAMGPNGFLAKYGAKGGGQGDNDLVKPNVVAPGEVWSAKISNSSNRKYDWAQSTSASASLVAGLVALLHVRDPLITLETIMKILQQSANTDVAVAEEHVCANLPLENPPNQYFGYGVINVKKALEIQTTMLTHNT